MTKPSQSEPLLDYNLDNSHKRIFWRRAACACRNGRWVGEIFLKFHWKASVGSPATTVFSVTNVSPIDSVIFFRFFTGLQTKCDIWEIVFCGGAPFVGSVMFTWYSSNFSRCICFLHCVIFCNSKCQLLTMGFGQQEGRTGSVHY